MLHINLLQPPGAAPRDAGPLVCEFPQSEALRRAAQACAAGIPAVLSVDGPEGCGKTAYLAHADRMLTALGFHTVWVAPGAPSEDPRVCLRAWWRAVDDAARARVCAPLEGAPPSLRREAAADALWRGLQRQAERRPQALLVDGWTFLDGLAAAAVGRALYALDETPARIMLVAAGGDPAVQDRARVRVSPGSLGKEQLARMAQVLLPDRHVPLRALMDVTGGLPQFAMHLLRACAEQRDMQPEACIEHARGLRPADLIDARLSHLDGDALEILSLVSLVGRPAPLGLLCTVMGRPAAITAPRVAALATRGWLRYERPYEVVVAERLVVERVRAHCARDVLRRLHAGIGAGLARVGAAPAEAAAHLLRGGALGEDAVRRALPDLHAVGAAAEAGALIEAATGAAPSAGEDDASGAMLTRIAHLYAGGRLDEALTVLDQGHADGGPYRQWISGVFGGAILARAGRFEEAAARIDLAAGQAQALDAGELAGRTCCARAHWLRMKGDVEGARREMAQAYTRLAGAAGPLAARAALGEGAAALARSDYQRAARLFREACAACSRSVWEHWPWEASAPWDLLSDQASRGAAGRDEADHALAAALAERRLTHDAMRTAWALLRLARVSGMQGNDGLALACVAQALRGVRRRAGTVLTACAHLVTAEVSTNVGQYLRAMRAITAALEDFAAGGDVRGAAESLLAAARLLRTFGAGELAADMAECAGGCAQALGDERLRRRADTERAHIDLLCGRRKGALRALGSGSFSEDSAYGLSRLLVAAMLSGGEDGGARAQDVADRARILGLNDLHLEAALTAGRLNERRSLVERVEMLQGVLDLAGKRNRPETVVRVRLALAVLFRAHGREQAGGEFLRGAFEGLRELAQAVPAEFRESFLSVRVYQGVGARPFRTGRSSVENLWKTVEIPRGSFSSAVSDGG